ncbi:cytochrome P450 [Flagelloscypha sp. PMI_526]|nr:cytochrome P450 [Flagelloscypha sp. PMI_526]
MELSKLGTAALGVLSVYVLRRYIDIYHTLTNIPTAGPSGFFTTYWGIFNYIKNANRIIEDGYHKYPGMVFKVYTATGWTLYTGGAAMIEDVKRATDDELSFLGGANAGLQAEYTMGPEAAWDDYHALAVQGPLTRNITTIYPELREETIASATDCIPQTEDWTAVVAQDTIMKMVSRISNRMIVGLPLCRNEEFLNININYTIQVVIGATVVRLFPELLRGLAAKVVCSTHKAHRRLQKIVGPLLQERLDNAEQFGNKYEGRPNDLISWLLEFAQGSQRTVHDLCTRILLVNFAALHTTTMTVTHVLFDLSSNPQYIAPLREEVAAITREHGWSKASLQKMRKLDSVVKEALRLWALGPITSNRLVMKEFTFSNGQVVPPGYVLYFAARAMHHDEANYENSREYRPFRFSDLRDEDGKGLAHQLSNPDANFVTFGIPTRHICPGRFFASTEIKGILAHLLLTYDFKTEDGMRPENLEIADGLAPSPTAKLLFRSRKQ